MDAIEAKYEQLKDVLRSMGSVAVAYSSGVDSTLVLWAAHEALGDSAVAFTATSPIYPPYETTEAKEFCEERGIKHILVPVDPFQIEGYELNPTDRCYVCKKMIFGGLIEAAHEMGLAAVADGTNASDTGMYRPGMRALAELDVRSPLKEVGLTKDEIREISRRVGLPTAAKPSFACLMTRFQYGQRITEELLGMVGQAELFLLDEGFRHLRVRYHEGGIARIELAPQEMARMLEPGMAERVDARLHELGFQFVTLDLGGYATGKMNAAVEAALLEQQQ